MPEVWYRIKHLPTGLYYCPYRMAKVEKGPLKGQLTKSNLSKRGKMYPHRPSLTWCKEIYSHLTNFDSHACLYNPPLIPTQESEWAIEEVNLG